MHTSLVLENEKNLKIVRQVLTAYLDEKGQRKTPERYAILEEIYATDHHFDVDDLHFKMRSKNFRVSRATIYNNLDLLIDAKLIRKHQFHKGMAHYEKSYFDRQHDHVILTNTGEVLEFCDPRIQHIKKTIEEVFDINIESHSLYFYGTRQRKMDVDKKIT